MLRYSADWEKIWRCVYRDINTLHIKLSIYSLSQILSTKEVVGLIPHTKNVVV